MQFLHPCKMHKCNFGHLGNVQMEAQMQVYTKRIVARMSGFCALYRHPAPFARPRGMERYTVTLDRLQALHPQNVLAYEYNGEKLQVEHGAPLRLASPVNVGWKSAKYVRFIYLVNEDLGGFWENQGYPRYYGF